MAEPLLTKDAINLGGHKFPIALVGALAAVAGVVLVLRARSQGAQVASVGATPALSPDLSGFTGVAGQTDAATLADLQTQIASLTQQQAAAPTPNWMGILRGNVNPETGGAFAGTVNIPIFTAPGGAAAGTLGEGGSVTITGGPISGPYGTGTREYYPIAGPGGTEYVLAQDITGINRM